MGSLATNTDFWIHIIAQKYALIRHLSVSTLVYLTRNTTCIASCCIYCEGPVYISAGLVKLDCLPRILGGLADSMAITDGLGLVGLLLTTLSNGLYSPFDLGLAKAKR